MAAFNKSLAFGKVGESYIAQWLKSRGFHVLPVYDVPKDNGAGPALFTAGHGALVAPDILAIKSDNRPPAIWIEAKTKNAFSWHRITGRWVTGIDQRHYTDYLEVAELSPWPVWLLFLHYAGRAKDTPPDMESPTGLFGGTLGKLAHCENHRSDKHGKTGMVYWALRDLTRIADLDTVLWLGAIAPAP